jgi:hypothetical protein
LIQQWPKCEKLAAYQGAMAKYINRKQAEWESKQAAAGAVQVVKEPGSLRLKIHAKKEHPDQEHHDQSHPTTAAADGKNKRNRTAWLAEAMLLIEKHPDWSDAKVARKVGKDRSTLTRCKQYRIAACFARRRGAALHKGHITQDADSGLRDVEAVALTSPPDDQWYDRGQPIEGSRYFREYCAECGEAMKVTHDMVGKKPVCEHCERSGA